jgi:septum site-determining protein MinC
MITDDPLTIIEPCFQLKGSRLPFTLLELHYYHYADFNQRLEALVKQAPGFFRETPLVISLEKLDNEHPPIDFIELTEVCRAYGVHPIAIKGGSDIQQLTALVAGLPSIPANPTQKLAKLNFDLVNAELPRSSARPLPKKDAVRADIDPAHIKRASLTTKLITKPVRSGQQIYAANADLVVLAAVSAGAEILADGNIHVYGTLRGRALAGIKGNTDARIFCQCLEAELLSIAGRYKLNEDLRDAHWQMPIQAYLVGTQLRISPLVE